MKETKQSATKALIFDADNHQYTFNGIVYPSVTTILSVLGGFEGVDPEVLAKAANRGTRVHSAIENFINYGIDDYDPDIEAYYMAFKKWHSDYQPVECISEWRTVNELYQYAGTIDFICKIDDEWWLIDFKTTYKIHEDKVPLQLEAYKRMTLPIDEPIDHIAVLRLSKDGEYEFKEYTDHLKYWSVFQAMRSVYLWKQEHEG